MLGMNSDGQLNDGTLNTRLKPAPVAGGLSFRQVIAGITQHVQGRLPLSNSHP